MPRIRLTKSAIDALPISKSDVVHWDAGYPGFGVKVTPKGRKVFIVLYRAGGADRSCANTPLDLMGVSPSIRPALPHTRYSRRSSRGATWRRKGARRAQGGISQMWAANDTQRRFRYEGFRN